MFSAPLGNAAVRTTARYLAREVPHTARRYCSQPGPSGLDTVDNLINLVRRWVNPPVVRHPIRGPTGAVDPNAVIRYKQAETHATRERVRQIFKDRTDSNNS